MSEKVIDEARANADKTAGEHEFKVTVMTQVKISSALVALINLINLVNIYIYIICICMYMYVYLSVCPASVYLYV